MNREGNLALCRDARDLRHEELAFLRRVPLFRAVSDSALAEIYAFGLTSAHGPGDVLFREGENTTDLYVIRRGVVEVRKATPDSPNGRVVSYLSEGECVGEMAAITREPRSATVRVPHDAIVFLLPGPAFEAVLNRFDAVAIAVAGILAQRLRATNELHAKGSSVPMHLGGDLEYFDLPEVCQTLSLGRRTGRMTVNAPLVLDSQAQMYFDEGRIRHASWAQLKGRAAVLGVMRRKLVGSFDYRTTDEYEGPTDEPDLNATTDELLFEALRQRDELEAIKKDLPADTVSFHRPTGRFPWHAPVEGQSPLGDWHPSTGAQLTLARYVLSEINEGRTLAQIARRYLEAEFLVHHIVHAFVRRGVIRV